MGAVNSSEAESTDELHQDPEAAPCHPSSSPLSPQLSLTRGTQSYLGPLIRVSDPYNILSPSNSSPRVHLSSRLQSMSNAASPQWSPSSFRLTGTVTQSHFHCRRLQEVLLLNPIFIVVGYRRFWPLNRIG